MHGAWPRLIGAEHLKHPCRYLLKLEVGGVVVVLVDFISITAQDALVLDLGGELL